MVSFPTLSAIPWLKHGFTTRGMGNMAVAPDRLRREGLPTPVQEALQTMGIEDGRCALAHQVHGDTVAEIGASEALPFMQENTDALICREPGIALVTFGADCPNVFLVEEKQRIVGLAHSGRLGTLAGIVPKTIRAMSRLGAETAAVTACISPSIGSCCYPTDLWGMLEEQLRRCGVSRVFNPRACTRCRNEKFFSYRASKDSSRMMGVLRMEF